uniref:Uncharacterized protein n=1 Tax=Glossina austeni TaxID=7395 RepID=A0A1A9V1V4_GLOAU
MGNVIGGRPVLYNNQPMELLLNMGTASLKAGDVCGCEISKRFALSQGVEDFKLVFDETFCEANRLSYDEYGSPHKLRVKNSWCEKQSEKYYLVMSSDWFQYFEFEVVVD